MNVPQAPTPMPEPELVAPEPAVHEPAAPEPFHPPTPDQVAALLERHPPRAPQRWLGVVLLLGMLVMVTLATVVSHPLTWLLPWGYLIGMIVFISQRVRQHRKIDQQSQQAHDMTMLRQHPEALRLLWGFIPAAATRATLQGQAIALMAHNLFQIGAHEAALVVFDHLRDQVPIDHPAAQQVAVRRAISLLMEDRLSDADDAIRRLTGALDEYAGTDLPALLLTAQLLQQTRTHHNNDAILTAGQPDTFTDTLRPLGTDAAYAHALVALAYQRESSKSQEPSIAQTLRNRAQDAWSNATLLLPRASLAFRFPELNEVTLSDAPVPNLRITPSPEGGVG